jgi:hypothetical protein
MLANIKAEDIQLLLGFPAYDFFLSGCVAETREFSGNGPIHSPQPYEIWLACLALR